MLVVGDLIADEYLFGKPARISREAPVLILRFTEREVRLGGAANAAHNVHALGARVAAGRRARAATRAGDELRRALPPGAASPPTASSREAGRPTPVKTRIMAGGYQATRQQVVRLDREPEGELAAGDRGRADRAPPTARRRGADAFLVSDYGYGTVTPRVYETRARARPRAPAPC